jgi:AraC-like DNA-binding protein
MGKSPNTFLKQYRLRKALELMEKKSNTLSEIAYDSGFNSLSYFSKCFVKQYSILPSKYQQKIT